MAKGQYKLICNNDYADYKGEEAVEMAKIVDTLSGEDVMPVMYSKNLFSEEGAHLSLCVMEGENGDYPVGYTDDTYRTCLFEHPEIFLSMMLHELGHFVNGDYNGEDGEATAAGIREERMRCILEGRVQEIEKKADEFAVKHMGKNTYLRSIDYLINLRKQQKNASMQIAVLELELRKKAVKNMR